MYDLIAICEKLWRKKDKSDRLSLKLIMKQIMYKKP